MDKGGKRRRLAAGIVRRLGAVAGRLRRRPRVPSGVRVCPYPFARIDVGPAEFVPCCYGWLTDEFYRIPAGTDPWNGPAAQELRSRILAGDYRYCKRDVCHRPLYTLDELESLVDSANEATLNPANLEALRKGRVKMPAGPSGVAMVADPRCNLACPSCRSSKITKLDPYFEKQVAHAERLMELYRKDVRALKMAGNGEVFFSPFLRKLLKELSNENYPSLKRVHILTNGTYMTSDTFEKLRPGSDLIESIVVSIDAGTAEVYQTVRGGDWEGLVENLEWVASERTRGRFPEFGLSFTVRAANFRTMPEFVDLGNRLGVSWISFSKFTRWGDMGVIDYEAEAVHLPEHPDHQELKAVCARASSQARVPVGIFLFDADPESAAA